MISRTVEYYSCIWPRLVVPLLLMQENEDFIIEFKGAKVKVTPVLKEANIHFIVHLKPQVIIAEFMIVDNWVWMEAGKGDTDLAASLGNIIEEMGI